MSNLHPFFSRWPSSQRRSPIAEFLRYFVYDRNVSYEMINTIQPLLRTLEPLFQYSLTRIDDLPLCSSPSFNGAYFFFAAGIVNNERSYAILAEPFNYRLTVSMLKNIISSYYAPNSFAQLRTRLDGHVIMAFSIVGFPISPDCFSKVHTRDMH